LLGTPMQSGHGPITFDLKISLATERWTRRFATNVMSSTFSTANGLLIEKLGAATLHFKLEATKDMLEMKIVSMSFLGIPSPKWLLPRIVGEETQCDSNFCFNVAAHAPIAGLVVGYKGVLTLVEEGKPR
jgi:Domain of unknown function (DUF4166)